MKSSVKWIAMQLNVLEIPAIPENGNSKLISIVGSWSQLKLRVYRMSTISQPLKLRFPSLCRTFLKLPRIHVSQITPVSFSRVKVALLGVRKR